MLNENQTIPSHLTPLELLAGAVEVLADPREKTGENGEIKRSKDFNAAGWIVPVELVRGTRTKALPDGRTATVLDTEQLNITVWSDSRPLVSPGMYVRLVSPMVGAFNGSIYVQCLGIVAADENSDGDEFSLERVLNEED